MDDKRRNQIEMFDLAGMVVASRRIDQAVRFDSDESVISGSNSTGLMMGIYIYILFIVAVAVNNFVSNSWREWIK